MSRLESYEINELFKTQPSVELPHLPQKPVTAKGAVKDAVAEFDREIEEKTIQTHSDRAIPKDLADFLINANLLLKNREFVLASNLFRACLMRDPDNSVALRGMGRSLSAMSRHGEALAYFRAIVKNEGTALAWSRLGQEAYLARELEEAYTSLTVAIEMGLADGPELFDAFKTLGNILVMNGDLDTAERFYQKAYTLNPESDVLMVNFGSLAIQKGDLNKAVEFFRRSVQINDSNDKGWVGLALIHREMSDCELSWANVEKALDINPANESAIRLVAEWANKDGQNDKAIRRLEKFLSIHQQDAQMTLWLAKFYYLAGHLGAAEVEVNKALDIDPHLEGGSDVLQVIREEKQTREARVS